jgi:hypothetical protein
MHWHVKQISLADVMIGFLLIVQYYGGCLMRITNFANEFFWKFLSGQNVKLNIKSIFANHQFTI